MTRTTRDADLAFVDSIRRGHARRVDLARSGRISEALESGDAAEGSTYVVKILDVAPGLGKVAGRRLLTSLGVGAFVTVNELADDARLAIVEASTDAASRVARGGMKP